MDVSSKPDPSSVLNGSPTISPACALSWSLQVGNKRQFTSLDKVGNAQKLDTVVNGKLTNDQGYVSIFSKKLTY